MESPNRSRKSWSRLLWLGFWLLVVVFLLSVGRWGVNHAGHSRIQAILDAHPTNPTTAPATRKPRGSTTTAESPSGVQSVETASTRIEDLAFLGWDFSADKATLDALKRDLQELKTLNTAIRDAQEKQGLIDFKKLLGTLGVTGAEAMTPAEAAAAFLKYMEKHADLLARIQADLTKGPWDWGQWKAERESGNWRIRNAVFGMLKILGSLSQADILTGQNDSAWAALQSIKLIGERLGENNNLLGALTADNANSFSSNEIRNGILLAGWTNEQLASLAAPSAGETAMDKMWRGLDAEQRHLARLNENKSELRGMLKDQTAEASGYAGFVRDLGMGLLTDQHLDDRLALNAANLEWSKAQLGEDGRYVPPAQFARSPIREAQDSASQSWLQQIYELPLNASGMGIYMGGDVYDKMPANAVQSQTQQDFTRIQAGAELYRRRTGNYPESLDQLATVMPGGLPQSPVGGETYRYQPTPEGYKLSGPGLNPTNEVNGRGPDVERVITRPLPRD